MFGIIDTDTDEWVYDYITTDGDILNELGEDDFIVDCWDFTKDVVSGWIRIRYQTIGSAQKYVRNMNETYKTHYVVQQISD